MSWRMEHEKLHYASSCLRVVDEDGKVMEIGRWWCCREERMEEASRWSGGAGRTFPLTNLKSESSGFGSDCASLRSRLAPQARRPSPWFARSACGQELPINFLYFIILNFQHSFHPTPFSRPLINYLLLSLSYGLVSSPQQFFASFIKCLNKELCTESRLHRHPMRQHTGKRAPMSITTPGH